MKRKTGFTLVELLVVISIIAALMAIMLPALSYSRQVAYRIRCLNNLKQLGLAVETYAQSYKYYPVCVSDVNERWSDVLADETIAEGKMLGVPVSLWPFHQSAALYNCPVLNMAGCDISYCYNWLAGRKLAAGETAFEPSYIPPTPPPAEDKTEIYLLAPEKVKSPATFILLYDLPEKSSMEEKNAAGMSLYKDIDPDDYKSKDNVQGYLWKSNMVGPHNKGYDILFSDGHTKWYKGWSNSSMSRNPQ